MAEARKLTDRSGSARLTTPNGASANSDRSGALPMRLRRQALTTAEQAIASVLLQDYPQAALLTQREVAAAATVSPPSVSRLAVKLGYRTFDELRAELRSDLRAHLASPRERLRVENLRRTPARALLNNVVDLDINNLRQILDRVDIGVFERLVDRLCDTHSAVYVLGSKKGAVPAEYLGIQLNQLRRGVRLLRPTDALPDELVDISSRDLLVVFAPRRPTRGLIGSVEEVQRVGVEVAAICDDAPPPTLLSSTYLFTLAVRGQTIFDSYAAMFTLTNALLAAIVARDPTHLSGRMDLLERLSANLHLWHEPKR